MRRKKLLTFLILLVIAVTGIFTYKASSAMLSGVSDLISNSAPDASSNHTIRFTVLSAIPPAGKIKISFEETYFFIPDSFGINDIDFLTSPNRSGPFGPRSLALTADAANDGVSITKGLGGDIIFTLNSSLGIDAGHSVLINFGNHAGLGSNQIINPPITGSSRIRLTTFDTFGVVLDRGTAMVAMVEPVGVGLIFELPAPERFNGAPSGELPGGTKAVMISLNTQNDAICRYSVGPDVEYENMANSFRDRNTTFHDVTISVEQETEYVFYVRCKDTIFSTINEDDFVISFSIGEEFVEPPPSPPPSPFPAGGAPFAPPPANPSVVISGKAYPSAEITILKDGEQIRRVVAGANGTFSSEITNVPQGSYTFSVWATDRTNRQSAIISSSITLTAGTRNIMNFILPPTKEIASDIVEPGDPLSVFGESVPNSEVEMWLFPQAREREAAAYAVRATTSAGTDGRWNFSFPTNGLVGGTYGVNARTIFSAEEISGFSRTLYFGIGQSPELDFSLRADINKDSRVNLVDFSILLFHWGTDNFDADINMDGVVNLADFSIMLFHWTG